METERFYYREYPVVVIVGKRVRIISEGLAASLVHRHRKTKETNKQTQRSKAWKTFQSFLLLSWIKSFIFVHFSLKFYSPFDCDS